VRDRRRGRIWVVSVVVREVERAGDGLFLVAHHPRTARPLVGPRLLGLGLAGALLGELVLGGPLQVRDGSVVMVGRERVLRRVRHYGAGLRIAGWCPGSYSPVARNGDVRCSWCGVRGLEWFPGTVLSELCGLIRRESRPRPVADWLGVLARSAPARVAGRLAGERWLAARQQRTWLGLTATTRWVPVNVVEANGPLLLLRQVALGRYPCDQQHRLIAGLVDALGLTRAVLAGLPNTAAAEEALLASAAQLDPALQHVVRQTRAAADAVVVSRTG
jgi:Golgi phosphoprotein 3 (GPP34)